MSSLDVICEKIHQSHGPRWELAGICVACVVEMMDRADVSAVRKRAALVSAMRVDAVRELLYGEEDRRIRFISSLLRLLFSAVDSSLLDQTVQVLLQITLDVPNQQFLLFILDQIHSQWTEGLKVSLSSLMFLGKLLDVHPALSQTLTSSHLCMLECVCSGLLVWDEDVKAAVCYVLFRIWSSSDAVQTVPHTLRQRMCVLLLHTLSHTQTSALTVNCLGVCVCVCVFLGVVKQMCQFSEVVSVLMNLQDGGEEPLVYQPLPLILKKLLLSAQDSLQVVSVRCVCAVLIHSPLLFSSTFIQADLPEFLLEVLNSSCSDVLLWSVFSCLLLLSEDPLFFSQCHAVYAMEPLVRCLKETLGKANTEVQKQGLKLLTAILDRQPVSVRLFPTGSEFSSVCDVIAGGMASSCLRVSMCAVRAAAVLFRPNHQSSPVQLSDIRRIVEIMMSKCAEHRESRSASDLVTAGVLLQTLICFDAACRLVEVCVCDSGLMDGVCSAQETLQSVCVFLLHCCDTTCIPAATGVCEHVSSPQVLQLFYSVLSRQFSLCPDHMTSFSRKLAASGFIRLTLERKAQLCSGNRNVSVNQVCCDFLLKLCMCLIAHEHTLSHELTDVQCVLQESLPSLCCSVSDWPAVLSDIPQSLRNSQYCLIYLMHLSLLHGDRFLSDSAVFTCVLRFIVCVQETLPPSVLSSALCLLSATQHSSPRLDTVSYVLTVLLELLCMMQSGHTDYTLLYHISNLVAKLNSTNPELLLSVFNFLYCFLCVCPSHATDRAVCLLLGNVRLMELLEELLSSSSSSSLSCSSLLLLSSLMLLQHTHSAQVQRSVRVDLHQILRRLTFSKKQTDTLMLMCSVRFVQVCLDVDESALVCVCDAVLQRPLPAADGALHPLGHSGANSLITALSTLMLTKQDLMVSAAVNCLKSLMDFLRRRNPDYVEQMVCRQPWTRFLLFSLLSSDERLRPAVLQLLTLLVCFSRGVSQWWTEVESVCEEVEKRGVTNLTDDRKHTLRLMLTQCCARSPPDDLRIKMEALVESLTQLPPSETSSRRLLSAVKR
ncbi:meiosis inhibitor protein 1 [Danio aesculapii]|uniref:meiosis inhibitor protein 1 n=1 Tax=Danio aesculapii TaxID=1142201 RepID=UPI0024C0D089|nr:meiosis inhibitor protein 1 [Danio aesculapii]